MSFITSSGRCARSAIVLAVVFLVYIPFGSAEPKKWNFDKDRIGALPAGWLSELSGSSNKGTWTVLADPTAPSKPNILAQTSADSSLYRFPLAVVPTVSHKDVVLSVQFKVTSGKRDQAAALIWRYRDAKNYYAARANVLGGNVVLYKVERGRLTHLSPNGTAGSEGVKINISGSSWHLLNVRVSGNLFLVSLNDQTLFEVQDNTFSQAGNVGLGTKADSVTHFDNFIVEGR